MNKNAPHNRSILANEIASMLISESPTRLEEMEEYLNEAKKIKKVLERHKNAIFKCQNGQWKTTIWDSDNKKQRGITSSISKEALLLKLYYEIYFRELTFKEIYEEYFEYAKSHPEKWKEKTLREWQNDYKRFYAGSKLENLPLSQIRIEDLVGFLDDCHKEPICKQRHDGIKTIYTKVLKYSSTRLGNSIPNLFDLVDYSEWKYESAKPMEHYTPEERVKLITYFRALEKPRLPELAVEMVFELGLRNGEVRGLKYSDFNLEEDWVHIQACAEVGKRHRTERVKKDSVTGNRYLRISPRVKEIYHLCKELSWSDEYLFVSPIEYAKGEEILISECSLGRALKSACKATGVRYLKPHEVRASNAFQMIIDGASIYDVKSALGHCDVTTSERYVGQITRERPAEGVDNDQIISEYTDKHVSRHVNPEKKKAQIIDFSTIQASQKRGASRI